MNTAFSVDRILQSLVNSDWEDYVLQLKTIEFGEGRDRLWVEVGQRHGNGVDLLERLQAWPVEDSRRLPLYLLPALVHATLSFQEVIQALRIASSLPGNIRYKFTDVVRAAFVRDASIAREVALSMATDLTLALEVPLWISAYVQVAPDDAAGFAIELHTADARQRDLLALFLEALRDPSPTTKALLHPHASRLLEVLMQDGPHEGLHSGKWAAVVSLAEIYAPAMDELMQAAALGKPPAVVALSRLLLGHTSVSLGASAVPLKAVVSLLLEQALRLQEVREIVDANISASLYNETLRPHVMECVKQLGTLNTDVANIFEEVFGTVATQPDFSALLTSWLVAESTTLVALRSLLAMCSKGPAPVALDEHIFKSAPQERQVIACRRLLNLTMNGPILCQFIGILADESAMQPEGLLYARQMLPVAMNEFPGATEDFLKAHTRNDRRNAPSAPLYRGALAHSLRWRRVIGQLPKRKELRPTAEQARALRAMRYRQNQEVMRAADKRSIFRQIATTVHVAQGNRFVSHMEQGTTSISTMTSFSHSVELPSSERSDPLGALIRRKAALKAST